MNQLDRSIESPYFTAAEAAMYLRRCNKQGEPSVQAIYALVKRGKLKPMPGSGRLLFTKEALDRCVASRHRRLEKSV